VLFDWTAVHNIDSLLGVADERHVQWVEGVECVVEFVQVDFAGVLVAQSLHYSLHFTLWQVDSVSVQQSHQVQCVNLPFVGLID